MPMPSFLKKSSSGAREFAGTWKCLEARASTSCVVWSIVRMDKSIYHHRERMKNAVGGENSWGAELGAIPAWSLRHIKYLTTRSGRGMLIRGVLHGSPESGTGSDVVAAT